MVYTWFLRYGVSYANKKYGENETPLLASNIKLSDILSSKHQINKNNS